MLEQRPHSAARLLRLPAEHWKHLRATNPSESAFATSDQRGCLSNKTAFAMIFKLAQAA
jgi:putative transposase